jgi:hypothetical protein
VGTRELTELNRAFKHRLTYPSTRRTGGVETVAPIDPGTPDALREVDTEQLARVSYELTQGISQGAIGGIPLRDHFKASLTVYYGDRHNAGQRAVAEFLRGEHCADVDMLGLRRGRSVIEAFGEFLLDREGHDGEHATLIESELLAALLKTLARHPEPGFFVRHPLVRRVGETAWAGYTDAKRLLRDPDTKPETPVAYVACGSRYFAGAMNPLLVAGLLWDTVPRPGWVRDTPEPIAEQARTALRGKGLLP